MKLLIDSFSVDLSTFCKDWEVNLNVVIVLVVSHNNDKTTATHSF